MGAPTDRDIDLDQVLFEPADPDQRFGLPAGELFEWAWLAAELADWLDHAASTTRYDYRRFFDHAQDPEQAVVLLTHIYERIAALLHPNRGQR